MSNKNIKIAFIGWNQFQLNHVYCLLKSLPNAVFIFENKRNALLYLDKSLLNRKDAPIIVYKSSVIYKLDDLYDVIICQTAFTDIHRFKKAKIAMIQYGYAKEVHNYGAWRSFADVCFTYGSYASKKISYFSPVKEIGYLRHAEVQRHDFKKIALKKYSQHIDPTKKTLLYMPTWGDLCSINDYLEAVLSLQEKYNLLIKIHHNTDMLDTFSKQRLKHAGVAVMGINDDALQLIVLADVVLSDYSGAIFDAIYFRKPVVLLDLIKEPKQASDKIDYYSIEYTSRSLLGIVVTSPNELIKSVDTGLNQPVVVTTKLYQELYSDKQWDAVDLYDALRELVNKDVSLSQQQLYVRQVMREYYQLRFSSLSSRLYGIYLDGLAYVNSKMYKVK